jgi:uncharacterized membrane protein
MPEPQPQQFQHRTAQPGGADDAPATASKTIKPDRSLSAELVTIARPPRELYDFWRDPVNLIAVMENVQSIAPIDGDRSTWTVKGPGGQHYSWVSRITNDVPGEQLTWQSEPGGEIDNSGRVQFLDAGPRGTIVRVTIAYDPPGGAIGKTLAKLFQREPRIQSRRDLHRLKQLMETGEIATSARNRREHAEKSGADKGQAGEGEQA